MTILDELIEELGKNEPVEQIRSICEKIFEEEKENINLDIAPQGPNIFLSLSIPPRYKGEETFITLEREFDQTFIVGVWSAKKVGEGDLRRVKTFNIKGTSAKGVIKEFAKKVKFMRGQ